MLNETYSVIFKPSELCCIEIRESAKWAAPDFFWKNLVASSLSLEFLWQWDDALLGFEVAAAKTFGSLRRSLFCLVAGWKSSSFSFFCKSWISKQILSILFLILRRTKKVCEKQKLRYVTSVNPGWNWADADLVQKSRSFFFGFAVLIYWWKFNFDIVNFFNCRFHFLGKPWRPATKVACNVNALTFCSW